MSKALLYRWFGLGRIPKAMRPILEKEGITLIDEGVGGSATLRSFRAPGRRHGYKRSYVIGSVVVTKIRFAAWQWSIPMVNVPLEGSWIGELRVADEGGRLYVGYDASKFDETWSGQVEIRLGTPLAGAIAHALREKGARAPG